MANKGKIRNPYKYLNGLVEIHSHGWQDTAFTGNSKTELFFIPPKNKIDILEYFQKIIMDASKISKNIEDFYLTFVMHPNELPYYYEKMLEKIIKIGRNTNAKFITYYQAYKNFNKKN